MNDMSLVIVPKADQISADDLLAGPMTITIEGVDIRPGTEQPVTVHYTGEAGRPWKPCKSMSRVLVAAWGPDARNYVGRSVTLYRDPTVKWGGMDVGGIRISHLSHIERDMVLALTATKGNKKPHRVSVLKPPQTQDKAKLAADAIIARVAEAADLAALEAITADEAVIRQRDWLASKRPELEDVIYAAIGDALARLSPDTAEPAAAGDDFPGDR